MLKEKLIDLLKKHPEQVDMTIFLQKKRDTACGTTGCLAGNILLAAGVPLIEHKDILCPSDELVSEAGYWVEREEYNGCCYPKIPGVARYLWAKEYGDEAAKQLPFYEDDWDDSLLFEDLKAKDLINYLQSL